MKESRIRQTAIGESAPSIEFATDSTFGVYIKHIAVGDMVATFAPCSLFDIVLWNDSTELPVVFQNIPWGPTITTDEMTGVITIYQPLEAPYTGISFTITLTPTSEGYSAGLVTTNTSATYGVVWFEFPRLGCTSHSGVASNSYLANGFIGGLVHTVPHEVNLIAESTMMQSPPNMQYLDYFDISNKVHLYISTEDDDGYAKAQPILGDGASVTRIGIRHFFKNSFIAGNAGGGVMPYTLTYPTKFELFRGKVEDGRCGYYDTAIRYRAWATGAARQAMVQAGGPWVDNPDVSDRVKDSDFYYIAGGQKDSTDPLFWTTLLTDMARIQGFIGTLGVTPMLGLLYAWAQNMDFVNPNAFLPPKFTPLIAAGNQDTALQSAAGANIHLSYYTLPCFWDSSVTGAGAGVFRLDDFIGTIDYNNIAAYCIRDKLNNPIGIPGFQPDPPVGPPE